MAHGHGDSRFYDPGPSMGTIKSVVALSANSTIEFSDPTGLLYRRLMLLVREEFQFRKGYTGVDISLTQIRKKDNYFRS
jgi:hypothetical protein